MLVIASLATGLYNKKQYSIVCIDDVSYIMSSNGVANAMYTKDGEIKNCKSSIAYERQ